MVTQRVLSLAHMQTASGIACTAPWHARGLDTRHMNLLGPRHVHRCACTFSGASEPSRTCVIAFLWGFVQFEAKGRISAEAALRHAYFKSLGERVHLLPDSKCTLSSGQGDVEQRELLRSSRGMFCSQVS